MRGGFLDGKPGLIFHVLQRFWFRFLVDSKIYEMRRKQTMEVEKRQGTAAEMATEKAKSPTAAE